MRLTPSGFKVIVGAVAAAVTGMILGVGEAYALSLGMITMVIYSLARAALWTPLLDVDRRIVPDRVSVGDSRLVELHVRNRSRRSSTSVRVTDHVEEIGTATVAVGPVAPAGTAMVSFTLPTRVRGVTSIGPCVYSLIDPFRLVRRDVQCANIEDVVVWPTTWPVQTPVVDRSGDAELRPHSGQRRGNISGEFATLADYVPGDDQRHIHWPSTARAGRLIVRRFEPPSQSINWIFLDRMAQNPAAFEVAVSLAASLTTAGFNSGHPTTLLFFGDGDLTDPTDKAARSDKPARSGKAARSDKPDKPAGSGPDTDAGPRTTEPEHPTRGTSLHDALDSLAIVTRLVSQPDGDADPQTGSAHNNTRMARRSADLMRLWPKLGVQERDSIILITSSDDIQPDVLTLHEARITFSPTVIQVPSTATLDWADTASGQRFIDRVLAASGTYGAATIDSATLADRASDRG